MTTRLRGLAASLLVAGCATHRTVTHMVPEALELAPTSVYPAAVQYELLGPSTAKACEDVDVLAANDLGEGMATAPGTGHPILFQSARYAAIEAADDADGLLSERVHVTQEEDEQCVELTGRAYRITGLASRPPETMGATGWMATPSLGAASSARDWSATVRDGRSRSTGRMPAGSIVSLRLGIPNYLGGIDAAYTWRRGLLGLEAGLTLPYEMEGFGPTAGITFGGQLGERLHAFGLLRGGLRIDESAFGLIGGGLDARFGAVGLRLETGLEVGDDARFHLAMGPAVHF